MSDLLEQRPGVKVGVLRTAEADPALDLPAYQTSGAAGMDLCANFPNPYRGEGLSLPPLARALVPTGLIFEIPVGYEIQIRPRSGLAHQAGVTVLNSPGTIDSDYRGTIGVLLINFGDTAFDVVHGMRIAQAVLAPVARCDWQEKSAVRNTARGQGGFGSTGR